MEYLTPIENAVPGGASNSARVHLDARAVNKSDVAHSFSHSAASYDAAAELQRRIGDNLLSMVPVQVYGVAVDLGCGTGHFSTLLKQQLVVGQVLGLDIAEGMLSYAESQAGRSGLSWCCGDAEQLPLADGSVSLLFSNLALQWCADLQAVFNEAMRVLAPGGRLLFSTLGPDTLYELKSAWKKVDGYVHVNNFVSLSEVEATATRTGFNCHSKEQRVVMEYRHVLQLARELKALGAHNLNAGRPAGLTGRRRLLQLQEHYEPFRNSRGMLPATYQTYYLSMSKN